MTKEYLNEILDFAIEREIEAAKFYQDLQRISKYDSSKSMLNDFEKMELAHANKLRYFKDTSIDTFNPIKMQNLKISDYLVTPEKSGELLYQDVLILAMKREAAANKLYLNLANEANDDIIRDLFQKLADEEATHKSALETMYDQEILTEN
jgi:rubrerythrin